MPKVKPRVKFIEQSPGCFRLEHTWDKRIHEYVKTTLLPWRGWDKDKNAWVIPTELVEDVCHFVGKLGYGTVVNCQERFGLTPPDERLRPYQTFDVTTAVSRGFRFLSYVTGAGKTPTSVCSMRSAGCRSALIICPASAREVWKEHLEGSKRMESWWPDRPPVMCIMPGKRVPIPKGDRVVITSFELLNRVVDMDDELGIMASEPNEWDAIVIDEGHQVKNSRSLRAQLCQELSEQNPGAMRLLLTATPATQRPKDIYAQLNWLRPKVQGTFFQFASHHTDAQHNGFGWQFEGCANEDQLVEMLRHTVSRKTHKDVAEWMPPVTSDVLRVAGCPTSETLERIEAHPDQVVVFVYRRATVEWLAQNISKDRTVFAIDGSLPSGKRAKMLERARETPDAVVVATMHSAGTGIDVLGGFPYLICPEISTDLGVMRQMIGRVIRMSDLSPKVCHFIVQENSEEERLADKLAGKLEAVGRVIKHGKNEEILQSALKCPELSDAQLVDRLDDELAEFRDADGYL